MANYITNSLEEGESIVLNGRLHWVSICEYIFFAIFLFLVGIGIIVAGFLTSKPVLYIGGGVAFVVALIIYLIGRLIRTRTEFAVTTDRFIQKEGILNVKMTEIPLYKVETVNFYQSFWQRMLRTGCIELVGSGGTSHQIHRIEHPMEVRKTIVSAINKQGEKNQET
ncbi:MAG: PH domain-containing protein [Bacteroidaceae bacterium]|nr:PH domain-containing protein [Bacteroidaceae bacterium]